MKETLAKQTTDPSTSTLTIPGQGFRTLEMMSDLLQVPSLPMENLDKFLESFLSSLHLKPEVFEPLQNFCKSLKKTKIRKFVKLEFLYEEQGGKGTWMGVYFRKNSETECQFFSNIISCAFTLVPDVLIIHEEHSDRIGPIKCTDHSIYLV